MDFDLKGLRSGLQWKKKKNYSWLYCVRLTNLQNDLEQF
jgi:hypothetical protein